LLSAPAQATPLFIKGVARKNPEQHRHLKASKSTDFNPAKVLNQPLKTDFVLIFVCFRAGNLLFN
jgi:hypothetical protein